MLGPVVRSTPHLLAEHSIENSISRNDFCWPDLPQTNSAAREIPAVSGHPCSKARPPQNAVGPNYPICDRQAALQGDRGPACGSPPAIAAVSTQHGAGRATAASFPPVLAASNP